MRSGPQFASTTLKSLEKRYGTPIDYYQPFNQDTNLTTGKQTAQFNSCVIRRALIFPFIITRGFNYDTAFLAAGSGDAKNLSFGAFHDKDQSSVIIRQRELPFSPLMSDFFSWRGLRFDVKDIKKYPDIQLYVITVVRTQSCKDLYVRGQSEMAISNQGDV